MEKFFELDLKVKELLIKVKPQKLNYDIDYIIKYVDGLLNSMNIIKESFNKIVSMFGLDKSINNIINDKFMEYERIILNCNYDYDKLQKIYEDNFIRMTNGIQEILEENFYAYNANRNEYKVFMECKSINDYLHAFHFYVINNDDLYHTMPVVSEKVNINDEKIVLYGRENELAYNLFKEYPINLDCGVTI